MLDHFLRRKDEPIVQSSLDTDFYKFSMGQGIFHRHGSVPVQFALTNRTAKVILPNFIDIGELREQLDHVRTLSFNKTELHYLRGTNEYNERMFKEDYLQFLGELRLPEYFLEKQGDKYVLQFPGKWSEVTYWEMPGLEIINQLYNEALLKPLSRFEQETVFAEGIRRLMEKIKKLKARPDITFTDFGTRRRFSRSWQDYVVGALAEELPRTSFLGTSNTYLAAKHGILPMGTNAHEEDMAMSGIMHGSDDEIRNSHQKVLQEWWEEYGWALSIALTDTYGTDFFFKDMTYEQARDWKGLRHDSGDPFKFGDRAIAFYQHYGIDPREKLLVFSDGLDVDTIIRLADYFAGRIKVTFGWGTNLTNDLGFPAISIIIKLLESNGHGTVKLSDNLAKAMGKPEDIERFKRIFGYTGTTYEKVRY